MIVVSDASPLHYLILIGQAELLPTLYGAVYAPPVVIEELSRPQTPEAVRQWVLLAQPWLIVQAPRQASLLPGLDPGEAQAIALAKELNADTLLIDDREGVAYAISEGLDVTGTLGVLIAAHNRGLASLADTLQALERTNYRRSATLFADILRKYGTQ
jgi:predicted nucleic acid-binding protein